MSSIKNILGSPVTVEGVGDLFPVKVKDYEEFQLCSYPLYYSKAHFKNTEQFSLLDLIIYGIRDDNVILSLERLFSLVMKKEVFFVSAENQYGFLIDEDHAINASNYEQVRQTIMKQNILHEQKVYENPLVQQWAEKVMAARAKSSNNLTLEDMITTVSVYKGLSYVEIADMTYYQLYADFQRIGKFKGYDTSIQMVCAGAKDVKVESYADSLEMYKSPYDDLFVNSGKLNDLNNAMG